MSDRWWGLGRFGDTSPSQHNSLEIHLRVFLLEMLLKLIGSAPAESRTMGTTVRLVLLSLVSPDSLSLRKFFTANLASIPDVMLL